MENCQSFPCDKIERMCGTKFIYGTSDAGKFGIIIIMNDNGAVLGHLRYDQFKAVFDRLIEISVQKGKGNFCREVMLRV